MRFAGRMDGGPSPGLPVSASLLRKQSDREPLLGFRFAISHFNETTSLKLQMQHATPEEKARLATALHEALPANAINSLCAHIANALANEWSVPINAREVDYAIWEWVRLSRIAPNRERIDG